jgi:hypothetical protein
MQSLTTQHKILSWVYLILLVVMSLFIFKDYGISWDEPVQRGIGTAAYNYVDSGDRTYMQIKDKIYGVGFELPLIFLEKLFNLTDTRDIYLFRHLINSLFFCLASFIFFRLNLKLFQKWVIAIIPTFMLLLSPRIFGHAFFNSKDLPFLCMYIISFYTLYNYLLHPTHRRLILLAITAGLLINFRIMGILFLATVLGSIGVLFIQQRKRKYLWHGVIFTLLASLILYATWPYLWEQPLVRFQNAFTMMSKFPWIGTLLFRGEVIQPGEQLTNYLFTWMGITIPVVYILMGILGILVFLWQSIRKPKQIFDSPMKLMGFVFLLNLLAPIAAVLYLKSVLYDDWRQLYFIYPAFIVFAGYLWFYLRQQKPNMARFIFVGMVGYFGYIGIQMIRLHPYQQVYFNEAVSHKPNYLKEHYDLDYWGTSFYQGLQYIAKTDDSDTIPIFLFHEALRRNVLLLPEKDRNRFVFLQENGEAASTYYLTTFRFDQVDIIGHSHFKEVVYEVKRQNSPILRIWKH